MKFGSNPHDPIVSPEQERATEAFLARQYERKLARELAELDRLWSLNPHMDHDFGDAA